MSENNAEELSLPKATVQKIVTEILPKDLTFSREARDALIESCVTFIMILSTESNEVAEKESKKTISPEHVIKALEQLGFPEYIEPSQEAIKVHKETMKVRERKVGKLEQTGRSEEDLQKEQELLFANARQKMIGGDIKEEVQIPKKEEELAPAAAASEPTEAKQEVGESDETDME